MKLLHFATLGLSILLFASPAAAGEFSWQQRQASPQPTGTLEWSPQPFEFTHGDIVRYIDFDAGDDSADGATPETAWKHHPWDRNASGLAAQGVDVPATFVFKGGVEYRGKLLAKQSGASGDPIRLTTDPAWGEGPARVLGSTRLPEAWQRVNPSHFPRIPDPDDVWVLTLPADYDRVDHLPEKSDGNYSLSALWMIRSGGEVQAFDIARDPNRAEESDLYPTQSWHHWEAFDGEVRSGWLIDSQWKEKPREMFEGSRLITQHRYLMGSPHAHEIESGDYDPTRGGFQVNAGGGARFRPDRNFDTPYQLEEDRVAYFIENVPEFLDAPYEYYYEPAKGDDPARLFIRLNDGETPDAMIFEAGTMRSPIEIRDQSHIVISGLAFTFNDPEDGTYGYPEIIGASPMVRIIGNCQDITVSNCSFHHVSQAVAAFPRPRAGDKGPPSVYQKEIGNFRDDVMSGIVVSDNDLRQISGEGAIYIAGSSESIRGKPFGKLLDARILRNRIVRSGFRARSSPTSTISAIRMIDGEVTEVAGNIIHHSWGNGIFVNGGKQGRHMSGFNEVPLVRNLVYDNEVRDTMLVNSDYGGINIYQGGPSYVFNNVVHNAIGAKTFTGGELGYNLYLDGAFKVYSFNNILTGRLDPENPDYYSHCGYFMVFGFLNHFWNNTLWRFEYGLNGSSGNRSAVLSNVFVDMSKSFIGQNRPGDVSMLGGGDTGEEGRKGIPTMSYADNVFYGDPKGGYRGKGNFGFVGGISERNNNEGATVITGDTLEELSGALADMQARLSSIGVQTDRDPLAAPAEGNFSLAPDSAAIDRGSIVFVPWALSRVVGEWHFLQSKEHPEIVLGENFYLTREHIVRNGYYMFPRNNLLVHEASADAYVSSPLDDWILGALHFDGETRYASLSHEEMVAEVTYPFSVKNDKSVEGGTMTIPGDARPTLDMETNDFLIEVYFRAQKGQTGGTIVSKGTETGYQLGLDDSGRALFSIHSEGAIAELRSPEPISAGIWTHLIAEIDRDGEWALYLDGTKVASAPAPLSPDESLSNRSDFMVGRSETGHWFAGDLAFLRVARDTIAAARTSIDELYAWQFDGPQTRDFMNRLPAGERRDAGALEGAN